jgi:hypothetical protein
MRLLDPYGQRARIAQAFDDTDDLLSPIAQIDLPMENEASRYGVERFDHSGRDGTE